MFINKEVRHFLLESNLGLLDGFDSEDGLCPLVLGRFLQIWSVKFSAP